jgi:serine/threonine protein kinase
MQEEVALLFHEVADLAPAARHRYFEEHGVPPELRDEVESLLQFDLPDGEFADAIAAAAGAVLETPGSEQGLRCGPYRLMRLLGRGGAGEVFLAERADGQVEQRVAIKLMQPGASRRSFRLRFLRERQILASLQHPGIARLLDAGETEQGKPYLVMDYVDGVPIDVYARDLELRGKLRLFLKVCDAVSYAHRQLIIHRDLKPSNILVDGSGEAKLLDFGIAKILDASTDQTRTQERFLTPEYASPEQVRGGAQSTATDVYSLGAVLYRLLTGQPPHEFPDPAREAVDRTICTTEPLPASRRNAALPRDLDFIVLKALRKEPEHRYSSVEAMANDIRAFLEWRPIRARSGNAWYRTRKFVRRYRAVVTAAALTIAGLSVGLYAANRERLIAQERFQQLHLLSSKVFDLDTRIRQLPGSTDARHELVSMSVEYLERLGASAHGDLGLAQEIGAAYMRTARIQGVPTNANLGDFRKAEASLEKGEQFIGMVLKSRPQSTAALLVSAGIAHDRMILSASQIHDDKAKEYAARAAARLDELFPRAKLTADERYEVSKIYANIALNDVNLHSYDEAVRYARKSIEASAALPAAPRLRASSLSLIGSSLRSQGRLEEALLSLREARRIAETAPYANPQERAFTLYGILLREARTLGQDGGISFARYEEAIPIYQEAVDLMEAEAARDPRDQNARDRLAICSRELAELLEEQHPQQSLAIFDAGIERLREVKNNLRARRMEAYAVAESSYPLRRLHRLPEALRRIEAAFDLLREIKDYPAQTIRPDSEVVVALRAQADYESQAGDRRRAATIYERLFDAMMSAKPDPLADLGDASKVSMMYYYMAGVYRRAGDAGKAGEMDAKRLQLWRHWDGKLPNNSYVQRQLSLKSE